MKPDGYYTSGQFAKMARISVRTVRFYDKQNILKPSYVSPAGSRFYTDKDFARLQQILLLKYLGFSLEDIREMTIDDTDYHFTLNSLALQQKLVQDRIEQLQLVEKAIEEEKDIISEIIVKKTGVIRKRVGDTDVGKNLKQEIADLEQLLKFYESGELKQIK